MKILLTGGGGQLGKSLVKTLADENQLVAWGRDQLDITQPLVVLQRIRRLNPRLVIHCAAWTDVVRCEKDFTQAYAVNALGTRNVALAAREVGAKLVYISTDFVFSGETETPYIEFDAPKPLNIYGRSKLAGEKIVQQLLDDYYIIRTAWLFSEYGKNFVTTMLSLAKEKEQIQVVADQIGSPTYTGDLAQAIQKIISRPYYGIYHAVNSGAASWFELAQEIFRKLKISTDLQPIFSDEYEDGVKRPAYSVLENFNLEHSYGYQMPHWREGLERCLDAGKENFPY